MVTTTGTQLIEVALSDASLSEASMHSYKTAQELRRSVLSQIGASSIFLEVEKTRLRKLK